MDDFVKTLCRLKLASQRFAHEPAKWSGDERKNAPAPETAEYYKQLDRTNKNKRSYLAACQRSTKSFEMTLIFLLHTPEMTVDAAIVKGISVGLASLLCDLWEANKQMFFLRKNPFPYAIALKDVVFAACSQGGEDEIMNDLEMLNPCKGDTEMKQYDYVVEKMIKNLKAAVMYPILEWFEWDLGTLCTFQMVYKSLDPCDSKKIASDIEVCKELIAREEMEEENSFAEYVMLASRNGLVACVGEKRKLTKEAVKKNAWRLDKKMK